MIEHRLIFTPPRTPLMHLLSLRFESHKEGIGEIPRTVE